MDSLNHRLGSKGLRELHNFGSVPDRYREKSTKFIPIDISDLYAVEVDFEEDLTRANSHL